LQQLEHRPVTEFFSAEALRLEIARIITSGALGRSKHYGGLLRYLAESALLGETPKEIELAIEVLGKEVDFNVATDSSVRVYIHQLRKKLGAFYRHNPGPHCQLVIPKGQYTLAALSKVRAAIPQSGLLARLNANFNTGPLLWSLSAVLLALNLGYTFWSGGRLSSIDDGPAAHWVWGGLTGDDQPILLVMGDYYIFGELNANGNIARMVREFDVNSEDDLEELRFTDFERGANYLDLNLSYMPEGSAYALAKIVPILEKSGKTVNVTMMSDLTASDIHDNHIVYIGYISALDKLAEMTFASSGLRLGRSYDELFDRASLQFFTSDAGLPGEGEAFRDYGLVSLFPASSETQIVIIAGMRDAGLMHTAKALADTESLNDLTRALETADSSSPVSFEALYEVFGVDRLNFDANLVYTHSLDPKQIWKNSLGRKTRPL
jgi:hypothetical protein